MPDSKLRLLIKISPDIITFLSTNLSQYIRSIFHRLTYTPTASPRNIIILGASFSGAHLAKRLACSIPNGYRVILIERNTHFNYTFNFPRYSVTAGKGGNEGKAFIPYTGLADAGGKGSLSVLHGEVIGVEEGEVVVRTEKGEERVPWEFLCVTTGCSQNLPAKVKGTTKVEGRAELRALQGKIEGADRIAVVGGGAVGVQLVGDIKSWYPKKVVTIIHSRDRLLSGFGERLGTYVKEKLMVMGIKVVLGERPRFEEGETKLEFKNGNVEEFDLVIRCTGQTPNSAVLSSFSPSSISETTGRIHVKPTLQLFSSSEDTKSSNHEKIFALGDVAETSGVKMARAGMQQAEIAQQNILRVINGQKELKKYIPTYMEGALNLSLGRHAMVMYVQDGEEDFLFPGKGKGDDLSVKQAWWMFGVSMKDCDI